MFVAVNFDALAEASDFLIERRQVTQYNVIAKSRASMRFNKHKQSMTKQELWPEKYLLETLFTLVSTLYIQFKLLWSCSIFRANHYERRFDGGFLGNLFWRIMVRPY